ncbi:peptidase, putative [Plasmodium knowlesi strain H]|uniref:Peptidase, putative n=3 Tax=Plasmodium knowlesi TaxID=5850 RepID=A0A5K1VT83_PLAKH|nr:peptidase, putative [Plasmodium knowlesi strain H]OTN65871.1 putative Peptidase [Plasmodium knowlesi]CAA9987836.1 peptidase, putative [Plasmodium knowlesi strain H]SBO22346.1 peptidase, putative [Plasmodium knowlesi strain H]SBO28769.1 peptidase, putative [Plasmodium knowlesi strain H]VVS77310.1 peptidase, putative [Plasmodium knowlesi strain H]|eukprot:XP_002258834.1 peptidase, putative [Plasmodium knowlesi strain H]
MHNSGTGIRKIPPFMKELEEAYNICHCGTNVIEKCFFAKEVKRSINKRELHMYQLCIIHYQLSNRDKIYKISCIEDDLDIRNSFYDGELKMYMSKDGTVGCLFCNDEKKRKIHLFKNERNNGKFFFTCMNSVPIDTDLHKRFFMHESFCSFNMSNTLMIYSAESDDMKYKRENSFMQKKDLEILKKINNHIYTDTFGEQFDYSFFNLFVYNMMDNTVKYITVKDVSGCYYNPQFIDDTSFVCLSYRTLPYRLGIYAFNVRPNDLYLCTLNDSDIEPCDRRDGRRGEIAGAAGTGQACERNRKNHIRCAYAKLSGKNFKHTASPLVIRHDDSCVFVACLVFFGKNEESKQHLMEYSLVLIKLVKEDGKARAKRNRGNAPQGEKQDMQEVQEMHVGGGYYSSGEDSDGTNEQEEADHSTSIATVEGGRCTHPVSGTTPMHQDDVCNYKKVETEVIIREGTYTSFFRGLYTNEIKGCCYPYLFLNTIFYCRKISIAVHMFTKKVYRILIDNIYNQNDISTSIEIMCMKEDNLLVSIRNMLLNHVLVYCLFSEANITGDYVYLTKMRSYNLDFTTYETVKKKQTSIIYANVNDLSEKLFMLLSQMETALFNEKHPYIRRKSASFNMLYESELEFQYDVEKKGLHLPNFNLFNGKNKRNLILYIHGGPYSTCLNEYRNIFIFFAACGFDVLCINYIGTLGFSEKPNILNGHVNSIEIEDIIDAFKNFYNYFGDYENVYLYGGSYGGFASCAILTKCNLFKSCCVINGVYDWILSAHSSDVPDYFLNLCLNKPAEYDCFYSKDDYGSMYEISPLHFVQNISTPILIVASKDDLRVSHHNSLTLYKRLLALKKKTKLFLFDDCTHSIKNIAFDETLLINVILWFYDYDSKKKR